MSCNCKNSNNELEFEKIETTNKVKVLNIIINFLTFLLLFIISVPVVIPLVGYLLFKLVVLKDNTINMFGLLYKLGKKLLDKETDEIDDELNDDDDDDDYELELEDVEVVNIEEKR